MLSSSSDDDDDDKVSRSKKRSPSDGTPSPEVVKTRLDLLQVKFPNKVKHLYYYVDFLITSFVFKLKFSPCSFLKVIVIQF